MDRSRDRLETLFELKLDIDSLEQFLEVSVSQVETEGIQSFPTQRLGRFPASKAHYRRVARLWDVCRYDATENEQRELRRFRTGLLQRMDRWAIEQGIPVDTWEACCPELFEAVGLIAAEAYPLAPQGEALRSHAGFTATEARFLVGRALIETGVLVDLDEIDPYRPFSRWYQ